MIALTTLFRARTLAVAGTCSLLLLAGTALGQTDPPQPQQKPQLQNTPMPGQPAPAQPQRVIIVNPDTVKKEQPQVATPAEPEREEEEKEKIPFSERLVFGGGAGLQFGDYTLVNLSPVVGYRFSDRFIAGPGVIYQYVSLKGFDSYHTYGGKVFGRAAVYDNFFAHTEYELLNMPKLEYDPVTDILDESRLNVSSLFVGGGYRFMLGQLSSLDLMVLFNVLESQYSPYSNPTVRMGFIGGW